MKQKFENQRHEWPKIVLLNMQKNKRTGRKKRWKTGEENIEGLEHKMLEIHDYQLKKLDLTGKNVNRSKRQSPD